MSDALRWRRILSRTEHTGIRRPEGSCSRLAAAAARGRKLGGRIWLAAATMLRLPLPPPPPPLLLPDRRVL